ncbi:hypothetical protein BP00DRAFT_103515 [Aspergillus indologenus CBS 114.80]|uniref:Uncharacterized protein n=1 Tax=Aspergillus indologenus CBS 114.80 TaxID=1450541 RepID=A0A2V5IY50_9EURO|nr:hypothetical protein BP00DRAFT_103515 [Aspergillus indologenus CBS 114.80]
MKANLVASPSWSTEWRKREGRERARERAGRWSVVGTGSILMILVQNQSISERATGNKQTINGRTGGRTATWSTACHTLCGIEVPQSTWQSRLVIQRASKGTMLDLADFPIQSPNRTHTQTQKGCKLPGLNQFGGPRERQ